MNIDKQASRRSASGGFGVGLIVGLLIGLILALGVALYITKVPVPFVNKVPQRTPAQDAAEAEKNRNWDPNSPLYGKNPARPGAMASGVVTPLPGGEPPAVATLPPATGSPSSPSPNSGSLAPPTSSASATTTARAASAASTRDPAAILADRPASTRAVAPADTVTTDPFTYFVQAGAYGTPEDAEQQRARLALMGVEARLSEREQAGRTVHRVRLGPFDTKIDADAAREKLTGAGVESTLVRVQR